MNINRYHIDIFFPQDSKEKLTAYLGHVNGLKWGITKHFKDQAISRFKDLQSLGQFIHGLKLEYDNIFEYYTINGNIWKVCFTLPYNNRHLILTLDNDKNIVTVFDNETKDKELNAKENYTKGEGVKV